MIFLSLHGKEKPALGAGLLRSDNYSLGIFALSSGARSVNTSARLHDAGPNVGLHKDEIAAVDAAFSHVLRIRLTHQVASGKSGGNAVPLSGLNEVDRAILKESLKQARRLQQRLKLNYAL